MWLIQSVAVSKGLRASINKATFIKEAGPPGEPRTPRIGTSSSPSASLMEPSYYGKARVETLVGAAIGELRI